MFSDPENVRVAVGISLLSGLQAEIYSYFRFGGSHLKKVQTKLNIVWHYIRLFSSVLRNMHAKFHAFIINGNNFTLSC